MTMSRNNLPKKQLINETRTMIIKNVEHDGEYAASVARKIWLNCNIVKSIVFKKNRKNSKVTRRNRVS